MRMFHAEDMRNDDAIRSEVQRLLNGFRRRCQHLRQGRETLRFGESQKLVQRRQVEGSVFKFENEG